MAFEAKKLKIINNTMKMFDAMLSNEPNNQYTLARLLGNHVAFFFFPKIQLGHTMLLGTSAKLPKSKLYNTS